MSEGLGGCCVIELGQTPSDSRSICTEEATSALLQRYLSGRESLESGLGTRSGFGPHEVTAVISQSPAATGAAAEAARPAAAEGEWREWHRSARFLLTSIVFAVDFLLRMASAVVYARHYLLGAVVCQVAFQLLGVALSVRVMWCDADVRRWLQLGSRMARGCLFFLLLLLLGCCQVIHLKRSWARQLRNAEVLRNLDGRDFLWAGPVLGGERTLPVALLTGVPFALLSAFVYLTLDCSTKGSRSPSLQHFCAQESGIEVSILACSTLSSSVLVALGVVDLDLALSAFVSRRYHFDLRRRGSRAGRCQCLYPAVHVAFRLCEVLLRLALLTEAAVLAQALLGPQRGLQLAAGFLLLDFLLGAGILHKCAPLSESTLAHAFVALGLLLVDVTHFVDRPGFCWPASQIKRMLTRLRFVQVFMLVCTALVLLLLDQESRILTSQRWLRGLGLLSVAATTYSSLRLSPMIARVGDDLHTACYRRRLRRLRKLLEAGSGGEALDVNGRTRDREGVTPLILATAVGDLDAMKLLLDAGARIQAHDHKRTTCLHRAVSGLRLEALAFLLSQPGTKRLVAEDVSLWHLAEKSPEAPSLLSLLRSALRGDAGAEDGHTAAISGRSQSDRGNEQCMRCVLPRFTSGSHLHQLFPEELPDTVPPPQELNSVTALVFAHASGALARAVLPSRLGLRPLWLEQLRRVRTLGSGALGRVLEVELLPGSPLALGAAGSTTANAAVRAAASQGSPPGTQRSCRSEPASESTADAQDAEAKAAAEAEAEAAPQQQRFAMKLQAKTQAQASWQACAEVVALRRAAHPFIVRLEHAFQTPDYYILLLELCPGGDLNQMICGTVDKHGRRSGLSLQLSARFGGQILLALLHLHEQLGIIYRDLKPQNILISKNDEAKLADFGTAQYVGRDAAALLSLAGTRGFLAPELVLAESQEHGVLKEPQKTDAFSYGVTMELMPLGEDAAESELELDDNDSASASSACGAGSFCGCLLPRMQPESETMHLLAWAASVERISSEAAELLAELLAHSPAQRCSLSDPKVRQHPFFLKSLGCQDLAQELLPRRYPEEP